MKRLIPFIMLLLISCPVMAGQDQASLKLGVLAYRPKPQVMEQWRAVADYLQSRLECPVELAVYDHAEIRDAVEKRSVDLVITTANQYILLQHTAGLSSPLATLIKHDGAHHLNAYGAVIFTLAGRGDIVSLEDLDDKRIASVSQEAFGGYQMPALELAEAGVPLPTGERLLLTGQPHDRVIQAVLEGRADAGFIRAGVLESLAQKGKLDTGQFKVINRQQLPEFPFAVSTRLYPEWPVLIMPHIDAKLASRLAAALYLMPAEILKDSGSNIFGFGIPANYDGVENLLRNLRLPPFDRAPTIRLIDLWYQYKWWIVILTGMLLLLALTSAGLFVMVGRARRSLRKLAQSERHYRTLAASMPDNIIRYDKEGRAIYLNPALESLLGIHAWDRIGKRVREFHTDGSYESYAQALDKVLATGESQEFEFRMPAKSNNPAVYEMRMVPERNERDEITGALAISHDISERKQVEQERQLHAQLLANMDRINRAIQGAADLDAMMREVLDEVLDIFSCDRAFLLYPCDPSSKSWTVPMESTRPQYPGPGVLNEEIAMDEEVATTMKLLLNRSGALQIGPETEHPLPEEVSKRFGFKSFMSVALYPKVGKPWQFGVQQCSYARVWTEAEEQMLEDIGRRVGDGLTSLLVQRNMRESQRQLVEAQRLALLGNWELDLINDKLFWSDEIFRIFEIDKEKFGASYEAFISAVHPDDREKVNTAYTESLNNMQPYNITHRLLMKDGRVKYVSEQCESYFDAVGKPIRSVGTVQDITEHKLREDELTQYRDHLEELVRDRTAELRLSRDAAEAANKAKSTFLANMSHELRTPLNAIIGFSQLMDQDPGLSAGQRANIEIINQSGEHLLKLINDVLEIAKIEAGKVQLEIASFDLHGMAREVSDMMKLRALQKGLQLEYNQSPELPRFIKGDEARMRQILVNLLGNAVKFTDHGSVTMRLGVKDNAHHHLLIEVEDTGPGISDADRQLLFKPFVQLASGMMQGGTGLGLSIVRQFVQLMAGSVSVESTPGKGSLFRVDLPLEESRQEEVTSLSSMGHGEVIGLAPGQTAYRILIAEDHRDNQLLLSKLMTDLGLEVKVAQNGLECIQIFEQWQPDLIWMDRRMPVMGGLEATQRIRQLPSGDRVKIVAVTASVFKEQQAELLAAGMDGFVRKPYRLNEIYDSMEKQLGIKFTYLADASTQEFDDDLLTPQRLSAVPAQLRNGLRVALESLDGEQIDAAINRIAGKDAELGKTLTQLVAEFDYPDILRALDAVSGE